MGPGTVLPLQPDPRIQQIMQAFGPPPQRFQQPGPMNLPPDLWRLLLTMVSMQPRRHEILSNPLTTAVRG